MNSEILIVDLQGFKNSGNEFIIKEFSLGFEKKDCTQTFLIKPPYPFSKLTKEEKKQVLWLEKYNGMRWSEGYIDYYEFKRIIVPFLNKRVILTKGHEKIKWIKELCSNCSVIDLSDHGCFNLSRLHIEYCKNHDFNCIFHAKKCALKNVLCIKKWISVNNIEV